MKTSSVFICQQCGYQSSQFLGKCPECGEWNSLVESVVKEQSAIASNKVAAQVFKLSDVKISSTKRISSGFSEFDRVLGGGIVPGSIVLISGDPGIGKSTLLLQTAMKVVGAGPVTSSIRGPVADFPPVGARSGNKSKGNLQITSELRAAGTPSIGATPHAMRVSHFDQVGNPSGTATREGAVLYVTGEESPQQVKIRADRISKSSQDLLILPDTDVDEIVLAAEKINPKLLIVDSIQTLSTERLTGAAGSVGQVRECSQTLQRFAKSSQVPVFLVGHVTKEGSVAGPKVLEHLVDAVLNLEGDGMHNFRLLRSIKNRFGSTFEVGVFEMEDGGLVEVANPSQIFLSQRIASRAGSVVTSSIAGGRPILAEVQALCNQTIFPVPTRRVSGLDFARVQVVIAALSKSAKLPLGNQDIFVNVAGGLKIDEPAADLAVALAVASAYTNKPVGEKICAFGEVGLLGELRPVGNSKNRINEAKRLGFSQFVTPEEVKTLEDAISLAIHGT